MMTNVPPEKLHLPAIPRPEGFIGGRIPASGVDLSPGVLVSDLLSEDGPVETEISSRVADLRAEMNWLLPEVVTLDIDQ